MGKRVAMPLCKHCGQRVKNRFYDYQYYDSLLRKKMILVRHKDAKSNYEWGHGAEVHGHLKWFAGRGYQGLNLFCRMRCMQNYLSGHLKPKMETL